MASRAGSSSNAGAGSSAAPAQAPQMDNRRERTRIRDHIKQIFEDENIEEGETTLEEKMAPGTVSKATADYQTNAFGIKCSKLPLFKYHVEIAGFRERQKKPLFLTKRSNDDCVAADRKARCRDAFLLMKDICFDIFQKGDEHKYYYDLQSTLVTTTKLPQPNLNFSLGPPNLHYYPSLQSFATIQVDIKQCETENELNTGDLSMALGFSDFEKYNRSHQAFIELATSQHALFNPRDVVCLAGGKMYLVNPQDHIDGALVDRCNKFSDDKFIGIGVKKSAKYIEGPKGRGHQNVALFVDPLKTAFYRQQSIAEFLTNKQVNINNPMDVQRRIGWIKGLHVFNPKLAGKRSFQIVGVSNKTPRTKTFSQRDGSEISIEDYFFEKYQVEVNPHAVLVLGKGKTECLPMDFAIIDDNQPVPKNKMSQREDSDMIKIAAQPPSIHVKEVDGYVTALGLDKMVMARDGIELVPKRLTVKGRILEQPKIVFADDKIAVPGEDGIWSMQGKKFLRGSECKKWGLLRNGRDHVNMKEFQNSYVSMCRRFGVDLAPNPDMVGEIRDDLEQWFKDAQKAGIEFLFLITDRQIKNQGEIKMFERKYEITTQNITSKVAMDAAGRGTATLENIIAKTNPKLGGTNYTIRHTQKFIDEAFGDKCLIIGVALSHSGSIDDVQRARGGTAASTLLSSVGYAANTGVDPYEFIGDIVPNNPHRIEILDIIPGIIDITLDKYKEIKGYYPSTMILYLNGSSEGEFAMLKRFEIPLVHRKMTEIIGEKIPLTVIIPQRSHMARINKMRPNPDDKGPRQNLPPGVVVDTGLVHPTLNEFYLNAHVAIQGTSRTPKYTILHNDNINVGMDAIQHMTYYLCYGHQIVNSPTSLPAPVYCAMAYAERGTKVFKALGGATPEEIIQDWNYENSQKFRHLRINA